MRANFSCLLAGSDVRHSQCVVGGYGVDERGEEGPLQVEDRCFSVAGE
jgi:hypothetical protein